MTITAVLIKLLVGILLISQANSAAVLPTLEARQSPQSILYTNTSQSRLPVIDTEAFNQCFINDWNTRQGSKCYPATYDFEICFKHNQTIWMAMDPATIYTCVCLPWPKDGRTMVNDTDFCFSCLIANGQPESAIGGTAERAAWTKFCSSNNASTVTGDTIQALLQDAPFLPALNQIESSATTTMTSDLPSGQIVGNLTTSAPSVTVTPTSIQLSGWETLQPGIWIPHDPFGPTISLTTAALSVVSVIMTVVPETSPTTTTEFGTPFVPTTVSRDPSATYSPTTIASSTSTTKSSSSASATSGSGPILGCVGKVEMLALIVVVLSSVVSYLY